MSRLICLEVHAIIWVGRFEKLNGCPGDLWHIPGSLQLDRSGEVLDYQALTSDLAGSNKIHKSTLVIISAGMYESARTAKSVPYVQN